MREPVLLLHGYDSKPSAFGPLADLLGTRAESVAGFEDLPNESFAWWLGDLSSAARQDGTEYLDEISSEVTRALRETASGTGLASLLAAKNPKAAFAVVNEGPTVAAVSVVGFSQGSAAALSWLLDERRQTTLTTVVAVAGFLPDLVEEQLHALLAATTANTATNTATSSAANADTKPARSALSSSTETDRSSGTVHIHMVHLSDDEVVDAMVSERVARQLERAGFMVTNHYVEGTHAWSDALSKLVAQLV
jgi:predicted esterase